MNLIFKIFGVACILLSAALISYKYSEHLDFRVALTRSFYDLLTHIKNKISVYLAPPSELLSNFSSDALSRCGFLSLAKEVGSPKEAYLVLEKSLCLTPETKRILDSYFEVFAVTYKDGLLKATELAESALGEETKKEMERLPTDKKLGRVVIFAIALGAVILLI